jgi:hemerythrin-like metal-binding protein
MYPTDGSEMDILLGRADTAMYQSKDRGGSRFTFWEDSAVEGSGDDAWIQWSSGQLVGFDQIDEQHRALVELCNKLHKSIRAGMTNDDIARQMGELIAYVRFHFLTESSLMDRYRYPRKESHDKAHARLLMDISHFEALLHRGGDLFVLRSIKDWLVAHIQTEDKELGEYLKDAHHPGVQ